MSNDNDKPSKFRPERPIYLNEDNVGKKTRVEVEFIIQQLRGMRWLCAYGENKAPIHMSFADEKTLSEFKKDVNSIGITIKQPNLKADDFMDEDLDGQNNKIIIPKSEATAKETFDEPDGRRKIVR